MKPLTNITTTNLEQVAPTIDCSVAKKLNRQLERGGQLQEAITMDNEVSKTLNCMHEEEGGAK